MAVPTSSNEEIHLLIIRISYKGVLNMDHIRNAFTPPIEYPQFSQSGRREMVSMLEEIEWKRMDTVKINPPGLRFYGSEVRSRCLTPQKRGMR